MTQQNLITLRNSLQDTLKNIDEALQGKLPYPVLTQFDQGGYTDGYQYKDIVYLESEIHKEDGVLLIKFYSENNTD